MIVRKIVKTQGGTITSDSQVDTGNIFYLPGLSNLRAKIAQAYGA